MNMKKKSDADSVVLPKSWRHWCSDMKLSINGCKFSKAEHHWFDLRGRGHIWRVNCHGMFQCGDTYEEFDRWALCDIEEVKLPQTREEFRNAVKSMLEKKKNKPVTK